MDQPKCHIDIFWSEEDGGYIANVPDLRHCSAFGEIYEEALREVLVAMDLHLATLKELGRPIPEPTLHQESEIEAVEYGSDQAAQGIVVRTGDEHRTLPRTRSPRDRGGKKTKGE